MSGPALININANADLTAGRFRVIFRRGEWEDWHRKNTILEAGEPAIDMTYKMIKIGDGVTPWDDLPYSTMEDLINYMLGEK